MKEDNKQPQTVHEALVASAQHDCEAINHQLSYWGVSLQFEVITDPFPTLKLKSN